MGPGVVRVCLLVCLVVVYVAAQKKGMAVQQDLYNCDDMNFLEVDWWWNWNTNRPCSAKEYVPMIWGRKNLPSLSNLPPSSNWVMAFDEPNNPYAGQDIMTPQEAASHWPLFEKTGRNLVSPAPALGGTMSYMDWLSGFFAACKGCRIDAVAIHIYESNPDDVVRIVQGLYDTFHKPVWLTEFCVPNSNPSANLAFMQNILPRLASMEALQRYSWVADRWTFDDTARAAALLTPDTSRFDLTLPGSYFQKVRSYSNTTYL